MKEKKGCIAVVPGSIGSDWTEKTICRSKSWPVELVLKTSMPVPIASLLTGSNILKVKKDSKWSSEWHLVKILCNKLTLRFHRG